jgi:hypothetical protein
MQERQKKYVMKRYLGALKLCGNLEAKNMSFLWRQKKKILSQNFVPRTHVTSLSNEHNIKQTSVMHDGHTGQWSSIYTSHSSTMLHTSRTSVTHTSTQHTNVAIEHKTIEVAIARWRAQNSPRLDGHGHSEKER